MKYWTIICVCLAFVFVSIYLNWKYEVIAFNPIEREGNYDLKVLTWNVHCSEGADALRQKAIAELILKEDADFVHMNEYYQDGCLVIDSLLRLIYPYTEEYQSHLICGDIFYSKLKMSNSGHVYIPVQGKMIQTIKAIISFGDDSVQIYGVHMAGNRYSDSEIEESQNDGSSAYRRYKDAQKDRCFQAHWTKEAALESKYPIIVMGDMNDFVFSAPLDTLTSCGLKDSWWEAGNGYGCTYHEGWMRLRIDHILHSEELILESVEVIGTNLSDHNPVVASFSISK